MNTAEVLKLRGRAKASFTKLKTYLESNINFTKNELVVRCERLTQVWAEFVAQDNLLLNEQSEYDVYEDVYLQLKSIILDKIEKIDQGSPQYVQLNQSNSSILQPPNFVRLPKINIPMFSGNLTEWQSFKDLFVATVDSNESLTKIHKFHYLKGLLSEKPAALIRHIPISEASYDEAWDKLVQRFDNKKQISSALLSTFFEQNKISNPNGCALRKLADVTDEVIRGLKSLDEQATSRDVWIIYLLLEKLDSETRQLWAQETTNVEFPAVEAFLNFLNNRCSYLDVSKNHGVEDMNYKQKTAYNTRSSTKCIKCNGQHFLSKCLKFKDMSISARRNFIYQHSLCIGCFGKHNVKNCTSSYGICNVCKYRHNTLLHETAATALLSKVADTNIEVSTSVSPSVSLSASDPSTCLLPTAVVLIKNAEDQKIECVGLLDTGSQCTFVSESCVSKLGIKRSNSRFPVSGIGSLVTCSTKGLVHLFVFSKADENFVFKIDAYILANLTTLVPLKILELSKPDYLFSLPLADPGFGIPKAIDILFGSDYVFNFLKPEKMSHSDNLIIAQNTVFGYVLAGKGKTSNEEQEILCPLSLTCVNNNVNIDKILKLLWEIESIPNVVPNDQLTEQERFAEDHFVQNYKISKDDHFIVKLPFFEPQSELGESKQKATHRFLATERKLQYNPAMKQAYVEFMQEYKELDHMCKIDPVLEDNRLANYLPHHCVTKASSSTTKYRVVFDASCVSSSGKSINSLLAVGPTIQRDLFEILVNFRSHQYAFTADIEKFYSQIWLAEEDRRFQRIIWREDPSLNLEEYELQTVTYGSSSSFLASRCLKQIAIDASLEYPAASVEIENNFYMDDFISGSDNLIDAVKLCKEVSSLLKDRGLNLRKRRSNSLELLNEISLGESNLVDLEILPDEYNKVLGLHWDNKSDTLYFTSSLNFEGAITKRSLLSHTARVFDPLGLLAPCVILLKILYQKLWLLHLDWDTPIPSSLVEEWLTIKGQFDNIEAIQIPRSIRIGACKIELHGFSDASELAYAAVVYCREIINGEAKVNLLVSKTKVSPIKPLTIAKLELCAALLLTRLLNSVKIVLHFCISHIYAWSDSKVVLTWLSSPPRRWKQFIGNRTSEILDSISNDQWHHIPSKENPADIASRGLLANQLKDSTLWWHGPQFLSEPTPVPKQDPNGLEDYNSEAFKEEKVNSIYSFLSVSKNDTLEELFETNSSLMKICKIIAYCRKWITYSQKVQLSSKVTTKEFSEALNLILRYVQMEYFSEEINCIKKNLTLSKSSPLKSLSPFLDENSVLRVGGRIQNSSVKFKTKHPAIIPGKHKIANLIVQESHIANLHAGPTLLSHLIKQTYWILKAKKIIGNCINKCIKCIRFKGSAGKQLMGSLPEERVQFTRAFLNVGIDLAGPIQVKLNKGRGAKSTKGYICLFVCLASKALHLEVVSDLGTDTFLAALRRFVSRRGVPKGIFSDNATNFIGAKRHLKELELLLVELSRENSVCEFLAKDFIEWHFIPPASPHFGGIWEAGVKYTKFHLRRIIGESLLTYEELSTLLCQIEGLLNSRPLTAVNPNDPDSINVLTPSHFLVGEVATFIPDPSPNMKFSTRWELIQNLRRGFWKRWHSEYLNSLNQRCKWQHPTDNLKVGDIVILKEKDSPPASWPLGRILEVHPGKDSLVRVVTVKTTKGVYKRPIGKVCLLPEK